MTVIIYAYACITRNLAYSLLPPSIPPGANWRQLPFTCFSIFTTWHSLPLTTKSDWGAASWCNWQSLCSPEKKRVPFRHCGAGERAGSCSASPSTFLPCWPHLPWRWQGLFFLICHVHISVRGISEERLLCHLHQLPQPSLTVHFSCFSGMFSHTPLSMNTYSITFPVVSVIMHLVTGIRKHNSNCLKP